MAALVEWCLHTYACFLKKYEALLLISFGEAFSKKMCMYIIPMSSCGLNK
jgi:hypothetical protein